MLLSFCGNLKNTSKFCGIFPITSLMSHLQSRLDGNSFTSDTGWLPRLNIKGKTAPSCLLGHMHWESCHGRGQLHWRLCRRQADGRSGKVASSVCKYSSPPRCSRHVSEDIKQFFPSSVGWRGTKTSGLHCVLSEPTKNQCVQSNEC